MPQGFYGSGDVSAAVAKLPTPAAPMPTEAPRVRVRRVRCRDVFLLVFTAPCPFCGRRHTHGGGNIPNDPSVLGHRSSHCPDPLPSQQWRRGTIEEARARSSGGYILVEDEK
jgi:hypothetical protein